MKTTRQKAKSRDREQKKRHDRRLAKPRPVHSCGGGYERIENVPYPLPFGRPQYRCTKCSDTWTKGIAGEPNETGDVRS